MIEVISVKFKEGGKAYYFDPIGKKVKKDSTVIVEMQNGREMGVVSEGNHLVSEEEVIRPLCKMIRFANERDFKRKEDNNIREKEALAVCEKMIARHRLDMKLIDAEYTFDGSKIAFFFTSDGRVDFRELVKDLAAYFHTRIELRQIGVRDEAKMLGGIGVCGQPYCCKQFLNDFETVSIKMAKDQGLSLNPTKVSGSCGRLMCCLKYEQSTYDYLYAHTPHVGATVKTPEGVGTVTDVSLITGNLYVKSDNEDAIPYKVHKSEVKPIFKNKKNTSPKKHEKNV